MVSLAGSCADQGPNFFRGDRCAVGANLVFALNLGPGCDRKPGGHPSVDNGTATKGGRPGGSPLRKGICDTIRTFTTVGRSACGGTIGIIPLDQGALVGSQGRRGEPRVRPVFRNDAMILSTEWFWNATYSGTVGW